MSNYNKMADDAEKQLNNISPTMCFAKWGQASIHLTNGMTQSCYHPPLHKIGVDEIKRNPAALHNTAQKKQERKMMLNGERPTGCSYCWKIEDLGERSDRIYRSGEDWAQASRKDIFEELDTGDIVPRYLEINFNQACNFKCMYCSPHLSTTWEEEIQQFGPYNVVDDKKQPVRHNDVQYLDMPLKMANKDNPYVTAFWRWWPEIYRKIEVFRMTGGEPLMDANMYKVLDYIYQNPNKWLEVSVTSNLCPPKDELFDKFLEKLVNLEKIQIWHDPFRLNPGSGNHWYVNMALKNFSLFISLDSVGNQAEYIRYGLNYTKMQNNVIKVLDNTVNTTVTFINTFNALSVPRIKQFLEYILSLRKMYSKENQGVKYIPIEDPNYQHPDYVVNPEQRIWFDVPLLRYPAWQSIHILPDGFDIYMEEAIAFMKENSNIDNLDGFYDFEIDKMERNYAFMQERFDMDPEKIATDRFNFGMYFKEYDKRKNTNIEKTFPELAKFYRSCST